MGGSTVDSLQIRHSILFVPSLAAVCVFTLNLRQLSVYV